MRLFEKILFTRALLELGAGFEPEIGAVKVSNIQTSNLAPGEKGKLFWIRSLPETRQQRRARQRAAAKGRA